MSLATAKNCNFLNFFEKNHTFLKKCGFFASGLTSRRRDRAVHYFTILLKNRFLAGWGRLVFTTPKIREFRVVFGKNTSRARRIFFLKNTGDSGSNLDFK